jgi:hypothetical protein
MEGLPPRRSPRYGVMTLDTDEFVRRSQGFHRKRYYGQLTSPTRANNIARIRTLLAEPLIPMPPSRPPPQSLKS